MSEANNTPSTNRGVKCANEETSDLRFLIDWCQVTVKNMDAEMICTELLNIPFQLMKADIRVGIKGYHSSYCYDDIRILESSGINQENGIQLLMSGQGCRNYEMFLEANDETWFDFFDRVVAFNFNVPRLDLAIDDFKTYFKISKLIKLAKSGQIVTRLKGGRSNDSFTLKDGEKKGDTLYLGSRSSGLNIRFYEKNYEQAEKLGLDKDDILPKWNRYELELRQEKATVAMKELCKSRDVSAVSLGILQESMRIVRPTGNDADRRRWQLWEPWAWFMTDVKGLKLSIEPEEKNFLDFYGWMLSSIAPSLWILDNVGKKKGYDFISELIKLANITKKHEKIVEGYCLQIDMESYFEKKDDGVLMN
jgi:phage replication initiation protein